MNGTQIGSDCLNRYTGVVWLSNTQLPASSQPCSCLCISGGLVGLCWRSLVDFPCWFPLEINIFSGPLQSSYFPGLIDDNGKLRGFVETLPSNPFTLCEIHRGLLTRSWLNSAQNVSLPHHPGSWTRASAELCNKVTFRGVNYSLFKCFMQCFPCRESKTVLNMTPRGPLLISKWRLWYEESLFEYSRSIFIHCLIIHSKL